MNEKTFLKALALTLAVPAVAAGAILFPSSHPGDPLAGGKLTDGRNGGATLLKTDKTKGLPPRKSSAPDRNRQEDAPVLIYGVMSQNKSFQTPRICSFTVGGDFVKEDLVTADDFSLAMNNGGLYTPDGSYYAFSSTSFFRYDTGNWAAGLISETPLDLSDAGRPTAVTYDVTTNTVYGCFMDEKTMWPASYSFGTLDLTTGKITKIKSLPGGEKGKACGLAADGKGNIYAILGYDTSNQYSYYPALYSVNKATGDLTLIGNTGIKLQNSYSGAAFDHKSGRLFWAVDATYNTGAIYEVDLATGACTKVTDTPNGEQFSSIAIPYTVVHQSAPALIEDLAVRFTDAIGNGTLSFTMPTLTYGGDALEGEIEYSAACGNQIIATGKKRPGDSVTEAVSINSQGNVTITVTLKGGSENAESVSEIETFIGNDTPSAPKNICVSARGNDLTISWTAPAAGINGGFIDESALSYKVTLLPSGETIAETTSTQTNATLGLECPTKLTLSVTSLCGDTEGGTSSSESFVAGPAFEVPYFEDFSDDRSFDLYTVEDIAADGATWSRFKGNEGAYVQCEYSTENPKDDWLFTPAFHLESGVHYTLSFKASSLMVKAFPEMMEVMIGNAPAVGAMTGTVLESERIDNEESWTWFDYSLPVTVDATGDYHFGFHAMSAADQYRLGVDDIRLEGSVFDAPAPVSDISAVPAPWGVHSATLRFRSPATSNDGKEIDSLTDAEIYVNNRLQKTIISPAPGTFQSVTIETEEGLNSIDIYTSNDAGRSIAVRSSVYTGADIPGVTPDFTAVAEGNTVRLTWGTPGGANGGSLDTENINYMIGRYVNGGEIEILSLALGNVHEYEDVCDFTTQTPVIYVLSAENSLGAGGSAISNSVIVGGEPYALPFAESFASGFMTYDIWQCQTVDRQGIAVWRMWDSEYDPGVRPFDSDGGAVCFQPSDAGEKSRLFSGCIDLSSARHPVLELRYRGNNSEGQKLIIEGNARDRWEVLKEITLDNTSDEWTLVKVPLNRYNDTERFQIAFTGESANTSRIYVDDIRIRDVYTNDLAVSLDARKNFYPGTESPLTATVTNCGEKAAGRYTLEILADETCLASYESSGLDVDCQETFVYRHCIDLGYDETSKLSARIIWEDDENRANNSSTADARNHLPLYPAPRDLKISGGSQGAYEFSWTEPEAWTEPEVQPVTEDFENYEPFLIDEIGDWTTVDVDGEEGTFGILGLHYPHREAAKSWQLFNLWALGIEMADDEVTWRPSSGHQFLVSFADKDGKNDDWLISPVLSGEAQTISFMTRSLNTFWYGEETFEVYASSTGNRIADFRRVHEGSAPSEWTKTSVKLPAGTRYFAIKCTSVDKFVMGLDDITYVPGTGMPESFDLVGYNFYANRTKVNDSPVNRTEYLHSATPTDSFAVTAVYSTGESRFSNTASMSGVNTATGAGEATVSVAGRTIIVSGAENNPVRVFTTDGMILFNGKGDTRLDVVAGVYVVQIAGTSTRVYVK